MKHGKSTIVCRCQVHVLKWSFHIAIAGCINDKSTWCPFSLWKFAHCMPRSFEVLTNTHNDCQNHFMNQSQKQDETMSASPFVRFLSNQFRLVQRASNQFRVRQFGLFWLSMSSPRIWGILISGQKYKAMDWLIAAGEGKGFSDVWYHGEVVQDCSVKHREASISMAFAVWCWVVWTRIIRI